MATIPENIIVLWPGNHSDITSLSGWSRVTSLDGRFPKARVSGSSADGGAATHNHTAPPHNHTMPSHDHAFTSGAASANGGQTGWPRTQPGTGAIAHTHSGTTGAVTGGTFGSETPTFVASSTLPPYSEMIAIKSDGTPTGFPDDCVVYYNSSSAPTDWTNHVDSRERFIKAPAACGNGGTEAGGGSHTHAGSGHTHTAPTCHDHAGGTVSGTHLTNHVTATGCCGTGIATNHDHTHDGGGDSPASSAASQTSAASGAYTYVPPFYTLLGIQNTSGANNWLEEAIVLWDGASSAVPDGWTICNGDNNDSGNATPNLNGKFVLMAASGGGDNGTNGCGSGAGHDHCNPAGHYHTQSHKHAVAGWSHTGVSYGIAGCNSGGGTRHNHAAHCTCNNTTNTSTVVQTVDATACTQPAHRTVIYLSAPAEPVAGGFGLYGANF